MHPRARRAVSFALSAAMHALLLLSVYSVSVVQPDWTEPPPLPVRIIEPAAPQPKPRPQPPPQVAAKPPEPAKPLEEPPPVPPPEQAPERKLPVPEQQIVSPSDAGKNEAPPETRLLSDRDNRVEQQTVKRGNPAPGESGPGERAPKPPPPKAKPPDRQGGGGRRNREPPPQVASLPGLERLMPDALRLANEGYGSAADAPGERFAEAQQARQLRPGGGADGIWIPTGPTGTLDFLPDVQEGDITLLNTKAEVFAPFVRRVAIRVFQNFLISLKRDMFGSVLATTETVQAEAIMDARGEMIGFTVNQRSTRIALASDRHLQQACSDGFFDRNPPPGARGKDGRIRFVFQTAVELAPSPRGASYRVFLGAGLL